MLSLSLSLKSKKRFSSNWKFVLSLEFEQVYYYLMFLLTYLFAFSR